MELKLQATKGLFWSFTQGFGSQFISFLLFLALARLLEPEVFGLVALAAVFIDFIQLFANQGFSDAIVQRAELDSEHLDTAFWVSIGLTSAFTVFGVLFAPTVAALLGEARLAPILVALSFSFPLTGLSSTQQAILQRRMDFRSLAVRTLVAVTIGGVVGLVAALSGAGVWSLVAQTLVGRLAGVLVLWKASEWRPSLRISNSHLKELFTFGIHITGKKVLGFLDTRMDNLLIGYFLGPTILGYYSIAYRILTITIELLTASTSSVLFPVFSQLQGNPFKLRQTFYSVLRYTSALIIPAFSGIVILAPEIVPTLFGADWEPSVELVQILGLAGIVWGLTWFHGLFVISQGKPSWILLFRSCLTILRVGAFVYAVRWGVQAVAGAYVITTYLSAPVFVWLVHRLSGLDLRVYLKQYIAPVIGTLIMIAVLSLMKSVQFTAIASPYLKLLLFPVIGVVVYSLVVFRITPSLFRDTFHLVVELLPIQNSDSRRGKSKQVAESNV